MFRGPNGYLIPADEYSQRRVDRLKEGQGYKLTAKLVRSLPHLRKLFALLTVINSYSDVYQSKKAALNAVKIAAGHCDWIVSPVSGELTPVPLSISFANMEQGDFNEFWNDALNGVLRLILPAMNRIALEEAIDRVMHFA